MEALSVRNFRNNLAASFDRADENDRVLIRRKNCLYALVSLGEEDLALTPSMQKRIESMKSSITRSWKEIKQMESGELPLSSIRDFINEL